MNTPTATLAAIEQLAQQQLKPLAGKIDQEGFYPKQFLHQLGALNGFSLLSNTQRKVDLSHSVQSIAAVGRYCGSTAFLAWCQSASAWYLQNAKVEATKARYFEPVATGKVLTGTGMSNTVKHLAGIERIHLQAEKHGDEYLVEGTLPWVSNVAPENNVIVTAAVNTGGYVMFLVHCDAENLTPRQCPDFSGMQGTATYSLHFHGVKVAADQVLAHPHQFQEFINIIKPGFVISQCGFGLGVIDASLTRIAESNRTHSHVNQYLDDQEEFLRDARDGALKKTLTLAKQIHQSEASLLEVLKLRAEASELTIRAANSAVLHAGARGYLIRDSAHRILREAVFVAIVTPALKHLRKEIHDIKQARASA